MTRSPELLAAALTSRLEGAEFGLWRRSISFPCFRIQNHECVPEVLWAVRRWGYCRTPNCIDEVENDESHWS